MQDELARLSRFVERSLIAARAERGSLVPAPEFLVLIDLSGDVVEDYRLLAEDNGIVIDFQAPQPLMISADPDLLRQILHGLLENATRYGSRSIRVSCREGARGPLLEIGNDRDPGAVQTPGLGIGLRLVRGICRASGFSLRITDEDRAFNVRIRFAKPEREISDEE